MGGKVTIVAKPNKASSTSVSPKKSPVKLARDDKMSQSPKGGMAYKSPRKQATSNVAAVSSFSPVRMVMKKQKISITAKPLIYKELLEMNVLKVIKKNNYDFEDEKLITECLTNNFFMRSLEKDAMKEIIKEMTLCAVEQNDVLFKQGSIGNYFYIIKSGLFELYINGVLIKKLSRGDNFGELALLHGAMRSGTVVAIENSFVYCLERRNFRKIVDHISQINFEENHKFINNIGILNNIDNEQKVILANGLIKEYYEEGKFILKEGDIASCIFIIKEGEVECISTTRKSVRVLKKGDYFGEKSILSESNRTMDVIAITNCVIYSISIETIKSIVGDKYKEVLFLNFIKFSFNKSKNFSNINLSMLDCALDIFNPKNFTKGETVLKSGYTLSSKVLIIIEGNLVNNNNEIVAIRGVILFEDHLSKLSKDKLTYDIFAEPDCLIVEATTSDFIKILGGTNSFKELSKKSNSIEILQKIQLFKNLPVNKLESLCLMLTTEKFEKGKKIITQGETDDKFYIIKSGKVDILINSEYIRTMSPYEYFGERVLLLNEPRSATAQSKGNVELIVIQSREFKSILEDSLVDYLKNRLHLQDNSIELADLDYMKPLGQGNFGCVAMVENRKNGHKYAIKSISKKQIDYEQLHINLELERGILLKVDHPFIVKLVKVLKNEKRIFFLMEYIKGKELFDVIRDIGLLNKAQTQFYGGTLLLAIEYLHSRNYIYRDIKPENVVGFAKLIDFGTVKEINDRTTTIIGTPHYMSPDVILGEGYSFAVDYWSIGVCLYEFMCGGVPFGENAHEPMNIYLSIVNQAELKFPSFVKDKEFIKLIKKMLTKSPNQRLSKFSHIKADPWFSAFNWKSLMTLNIETPYIPKLTDDSQITAVSYVNYLKSVKEWTPGKNSSGDSKSNFDNEKWFQKF